MTPAKNFQWLAIKACTLVCLLFTSSIFSQTSVAAGTVSGTWSQGGSPYLVQGDITVPYNNTLIIQPGVAVHFLGHFKFTVSGCLQAIGQSSNQITFLPTTSNGWHGLKINTVAVFHDSTIVKFCTFTGGISTGTGSAGQGGAISVTSAPKVNISNCSIVNNTAVVGGGIYSSSPNLIANNTITSNYAETGGGIYSNGVNHFISNNIISANTATQFGGGGICCSGPNQSTIVANSIQSNTVLAGKGGGIFASGKIVVLGNLIDQNTAPYGGGGISMLEGTVSNNTITANAVSSIANGGGIELSTIVNPASVNNNFICNNVAARGGGIHMSGAALYNNVIANNTAFDDGGAVYCFSERSFFHNNTIVNNSAGTGGGIYNNSNYSPEFYSCIIYGNSGTQIKMANNNAGAILYACNLQGGTSAVGGNTSTSIFQNNIDQNSMFVLASGGIGNGFSGSSANWQLAAGSPCIDHGQCNFSYLPTDLAGSPRVMGPCIDIGAYESAGPITVGLNDINNELKANVFPNPFSSMATIRLNHSVSEIVLVVYNTSGQELKREKYVDVTEIQLSADKLVAGIYHCVLIEPTGNKNKFKFIVTD